MTYKLMWYPYVFHEVRKSLAYLAIRPSRPVPSSMPRIRYFFSNNTLHPYCCYSWHATKLKIPFINTVTGQNGRCCAYRRWNNSFYIDFGFKRVCYATVKLVQLYVYLLRVLVAYFIFLLRRRKTLLLLIVHKAILSL